MKLFATLLLCAALFYVSQSEIILQPPLDKVGMPEVGLVLVQGVSIDAKMYIPLATAIQTLAPYAVYVGMPEFPLDLPIPPVIDGPVLNVTTSLRNAGLTAPKLFYAGHSLGGASIQDFSASHPDVAMGQILMGANLLRKHVNTTTPYPVPTLTLNGDLDGLMRSSRTAEAYYHLVRKQRFGPNFPVTLIQGSNHFQVASGSVPSFVASNDLKAEIPLDEAHQQMAKMIVEFIQQITTGQPSQVIADAVEVTGDYLEPIINALDMEAFVHFHAWCDSDHPSPQCPYYPPWPEHEALAPSNDTDCYCGSRWTTDVAMSIMAGLDPVKYPIVSVDAMHDVNDILPYFHHPHLWNNCSDQATPCVLNFTTTTQSMYETFDDFDTGFTHTSSYEMRVKMRSRQSSYAASVDVNAQLTPLDDTNICAAINQKAIDWGLANAAPLAAKRFAASGQRLTVGNDIQPLLPIGPLWIDNNLHYDSVTLTSGEQVMQISSPTFMTDLHSFNIIDTIGFHYCKLISPARVLEWMYTDGLRLHNPIQRDV